MIGYTFFRFRFRSKQLHGHVAKYLHTAHGGIPSTITFFFAGVLNCAPFLLSLSRAHDQLCINYCNEKLNNHFNEHVFKGEIAAYAAEGVVVPNLVFKDNKPILDFIEGKGDGIYSILDEQVILPLMFTLAGWLVG